MSGSLKSVIKECAAILQPFLIEGEPAGYEFAHQAVSGWVNNFIESGIDEKVISQMLNGLEFISDDSIRKHTLDFITAQLNTDEIFYTSFGEENESSARIIAPLNSKPGYGRDIFSLLDKIETVKGTPRIIFIDDFLNSGGQFASIIASWFEQRISSRRTLDATKIELLKKCELHFVFAYGMEIGRIRAAAELQKFKLNGNIHIISQYADNFGIFGSERNRYNIINRVDTPCEPETLFKNFSCSEISDLYALCESAGRQLYMQYKPEHSGLKVEERRLGYGNSAKLIIGQNNIPTCSLTCLWLGGEVELNGRTISWQPLFRRKEKQVGGSEGNKHHIPLSDIFAHSRLDLSEGRESGLEISISESLPLPLLEFDSKLWIDVSYSSLEMLNPLLKDFLAFSHLSFVQKLNPSFYQSINNHLKYYLSAETPVDVRIAAVTVITLGGLISYLQINFVFKSTDMNLKTALEINAALGLKQKRSNSTFFRLKTGRDSYLDFRTPQLFKAIAANLESKTQLAVNDIDAQEDCSRVERYTQFAYLREQGDYFKSGPRQLNQFIKIASDFSLPAEENLKIPDTFKSVELAMEANISFSVKGMVFTGSGINRNMSIRTHFFTRYGLCYYLIRHLEQLISEYRLSFYANTTRASRIREWLDRFALFPFEKISDLEYLNQFLGSLSSYVGIEKNLQTIRSFKIES